MNIKGLLLLGLAYSTSLLGMELESKSSTNGLPDGYLQICIGKDFPFYYVDNKMMQEYIQKTVKYKILDCMPVFYAIYYLGFPDHGRGNGLYLPLSCLFTGRNGLASDEPIKVIIEEKEYKLQLVKKYKKCYKNKLLSKFVEKYKQFIDPVNKAGVTLFHQIKGWQSGKTELLRDVLLKNGLLKNKIIESIPYIHGPNGYPAFMKNLSVTKARLAIVEKEYKNEESYFNVLPSELIILLKQYIDENAQWADLEPLVKYHERVLKEIEHDEKTLKRTNLSAVNS